MKRLLILAVVLLAATGAQAQSLLGNWLTNLDVEEGQTVQLYFNFADATFNMKVVTKVETDEMGMIVVSADMPGVYSRDGKTLLMSMNSERADARIDKMVFKPEFQKLIDENPETKKMVTNTFMDVVKEIRDELCKELGEGVNLEIVELTRTKLVLRESGDDLTFTRVK
ncbi:hypothetical protein SAMN04487902_105253 [Prevotella sp. ne3005]|jgi:hypothetical protein|uniref:hypothetical protein n=1 Tax=Prevotella sp. ne3005 TaxID=1761887 RepID=UPI0008CD33C5|nr:hypothetical protein [Prevotella sp. ne3005]SEM97641.1 hypothetical protein SAMN04487902_105253 [Prevotella sp. ne3005]